MSDEEEAYMKKIILEAHKWFNKRFQSGFKPIEDGFFYREGFAPEHKYLKG